MSQGARQKKGLKNGGKSMKARVERGILKVEGKKEKFLKLSKDAVEITDRTTDKTEWKKRLDVEKKGVEKIILSGAPGSRGGSLSLLDADNSTILCTVYEEWINVHGQGNKIFVKNPRHISIRSNGKKTTTVYILLDTYHSDPVELSLLNATPTGKSKTIVHLFRKGYDDTIKLVKTISSKEFLEEYVILDDKVYLEVED